MPEQLRARPASSNHQQDPIGKASENVAVRDRHDGRTIEDHQLIFLPQPRKNLSHALGGEKIRRIGGGRAAGEDVQTSQSRKKGRQIGFSSREKITEALRGFQAESLVNLRQSKIAIDQQHSSLRGCRQSQAEIQRRK